MKIITQYPLVESRLFTLILLTFPREDRLLERLDPHVDVLEAAGQLLVHVVHVALEQLRLQRVRPAQLSLQHCIVESLLLI